MARIRDLFLSPRPQIRPVQSGVTIIWDKFGFKSATRSDGSIIMQRINDAGDIVFGSPDLDSLKINKGEINGFANHTFKSLGDLSDSNCIIDHHRYGRRPVFQFHNGQE